MAFSERSSRQVITPELSEETLLTLQHILKCLYRLSPEPTLLNFADLEGLLADYFDNLAILKDGFSFEKRESLPDFANIQFPTLMTIIGYDPQAGEGAFVNAYNVWLERKTREGQTTPRWLICYSKTPVEGNRR